MPPTRPPALDPATLRTIYAHAAESHPAECCGLVTDQGPRRSRNVMDEMHALDPVAFPRTSRTGFQLAPPDQLFLARSMHTEEPVRVIYHSHVNVGAYLSDADRRGATLDGEPLYPTVQHLVVDAQRDGVRGARLFALNLFAHDLSEPNRLASEGGNGFREVARFDAAGNCIEEFGDECDAPRESSS